MSPNLLFWDPLPRLNSRPRNVVTRMDRRYDSPSPLPSPRQTPVTKAYNFQLVAVFHLRFYNEWF